MRRYMLAATVPVAGLAALLAAAGPVSAADSARNHSIQLLRMTGAEEAPGPGDADGSGIFASRADVRRHRLCYLITAQRIATPTAAHIHKAPRGMPGPILIGLMPPVNGLAADCITAVPDSQQTPENNMMTLTFGELNGIAKQSADYYVNVHNADFRAGAIRAQLR